MSPRPLNSLAYLTGARGPLRHVFDFLRTHGIGERVIKSALAAMLAFWLARFLPDNSNPILAPLTAVFSINLTIAGGMRDAWQRILGVMLGVAFALVVNELLGPGAVAIGIIIVLSFYAGRRLGLESSGVQQMAVSALLVALGAAGTQVDNVALLHLANTMIGTGVGLLLNASVAPPNHVPEARRRLHELGHSIEGILADLRDALRTGIDHATAVDCLYRSRETVTLLNIVDTALGNAEESLAYNLMGSNQREVLAIYRQIGRTMEHSALQSRIIARSLTDAVAASNDNDLRPGWLQPATLGNPLADLLDEALAALRIFLMPLDTETAQRPQAISTDGITAQREVVNRAAMDAFELLLPDRWILLGEVVGVATQLVTDLSTNSTGVIDPETGKRRQWWRATMDTVTWWRDD
ncbi:hypothetical protein BH20CHL4_BH20CHL4_03630 [soil metagenome]